MIVWHSLHKQVKNNNFSVNRPADGMVRFSSYLASVARTAAEPLLELGGSAGVLRVEQEGPHPVGNGVENTENLNK
jgi:hypothetical protein